MGEGEETLLATIAIVDVVNRYAAALDARDWERLRSCFSDDATLKFPTRELHGPDAIVEYISGATLWVGWAQHLVGSHQVSVSGDQASATSSLYATQFARDPNEAPRTTFGTYYDQLRLTEQGWKIARRELRVGGAAIETKAERSS